MSAKDDIRAWLEGKDPVVGMLTLVCVGAAEDFAWMLQKFRQRHDLPERMPELPPVDTWLAMYRDHNGVWDGAMTLSGLGELGVSMTDLARAWRELTRRARTDREALTAEIKGQLQTDGPAIQQMAQSMVGMFAMMKDMFIDMAIGGTPWDEQEDDEAFGEVVKRPEVQFFLRVCGPCWMEYGVFPSELMYDARHGDIDALDRLLRLDKLAMSEPRVRDQINAAAYSKQPGRYKRICLAIESGPRKQTDESCRKWVKCGMAGFASMMAEKLGKPLDQGDLRTLFDAIYRAREGTVDPDIPATPESFAKAIQRNRDARGVGRARTKEK